MDKKRRKLLLAVLVAVIAVGAAVVFSVNGQGNTYRNVTKYDNVAVSGSVLRDLRAVAMNSSLADSIGVGSSSGNLQGITNASRLMNGSRPVILFVSGDFCPFCAMERWGLTIALMRFGNFTSLHYMTSSAQDYAPSTSTFTYYNSSYSSSLVDFQGVEVATNTWNYSINTYSPLMSMNQLQDGIFKKYDSRGSTPFTDFANITVTVGSLSDPKLLAGMDWAAIISRLGNRNDTVSGAIIGDANVYTAQICKTLNNTAPVCSLGYVRRIEAQG